MFSVLALFLLPVAHGFFNLGGGCGCQTACPPPAPVAPCPVAPVCPPVIPCHARGATIHSAQQAIGLPDELEMRAVAFGVPLSSGSNPSANIEQLERLVEHHAEMQTAAETVDQETLTAAAKEIRRAPTVNVSGQKVDFETTTSVPETTSKTEEASNNKCNNQVLQRLMLENMNESSKESKKQVNEAAEAKFGGSVDVICSRGHFSYVFSSNLYCEVTKGLTTCIAFRQATA